MMSNLSPSPSIRAVNCRVQCFNPNFLLTTPDIFAELRVCPHKGEDTRATHSLTGVERPLREFLGVRCGSFLGFLGPVR